MPEDVLRETTEFLHRAIPLTGAMGVRVASYDRERLVLTAPLERNHNHLGTAFGGSLSALATLAGYALLWLELRDRTAHVVIRESHVHFHRPIRGELCAVCRAPAPEALLRFNQDFARKGKARLVLRVEIGGDDGVGVEFEGTFVALRPPGQGATSAHQAVV